MYKNKEELIAMLKSANLWAKKDLGQNFLVNPQVLEKIAGAADLTKEDDVIEVGPGLGVLTAELARRARSVRTIELDPFIIPLLQKNIAEFTNVEIETGNALKAKLPAHPYKLIANIPYYITSPLINHFLQPKTPQEKRPSVIVLLVQKEVAEKICARADAQSVLSLQVQIFGKPTLVSIVGKSSFHPQPQVDSAILKIDVYPEPLIHNTTLFLDLIKKVFAQRRKTLLNTLQNQVKLSRPAAQELLQKTSIDPMRRPQTLSINEWQALVKELESLM